MLPWNRPIVSGVTYTTDEAKVTVRGVPDRPGVAAEVFSALADAHVNVDMIIQNVGEQGHSDISCTVPIDDLPAARDGARRRGRRAAAPRATRPTTPWPR